MHGQIIDLVLLLLLILFLGSQQKHHPQRHYKYWLVGWIFVFAAYAVWDIKVTGPTASSFQLALRIDLGFCGFLTFLASLLTTEKGLPRMAAIAVLVGLPAIAIIDIQQFTTVNKPAMIAAMIAWEAYGVWATAVLLPRSRTKARAAIFTICGASAIGIVLFGTMKNLDDLSDFGYVEVLFCTAILYGGGMQRRSLAVLTGMAGFAGWGTFYFLYDVLGSDSPVTQALYTCWNIPKYLVAFSMILKMFEDAAEENARLAREFRMVYEDHPHPMWIVDGATGLFLSLNHAALSAYGLLGDAWQAMQPAELEIACSAEESEMLRLSPLSTAGTVRWHRYANGKMAWVSVVERDIVFQMRRACLATAVDITEQLQADLELNHRANHDALTGLPNRHLLEERLCDCLTTNEREGRKVALLAIDIDHFKKVNDTYGHAVGDACLKAVAARLQSRIRQMDTIARVGGEEFVAVVGCLHTLEDAQKIADTLLRQFAQPLKLEDFELAITVSIGVAMYPEDGLQPAELHLRADEALYAAKRGGRARVVMAQSMTSGVL